MDSLYQGCFMSLEQSLAQIDRAEQIDRSRQTCAERGLHSDSRDFAVCVNGGVYASDDQE